MKRAILIVISLSLFFAIAVSISAATIVEDYPNLPACEDNAQCHPGQAGFGAPQFIKYIYLFAIGIVGVIGLLAIIVAAFNYVTSAGNPQKASDAKDKIISALLGILLLLGSVVLLNLINPDLLKLKIEAPPTEEIEISTPDTPQCAPTAIRWSKGTVNAGESAYLIFKLNEFCKDDAEVSSCEASFGEASFVRQDRPVGAGCPPGSTTGWDPYCGIYNTKRLNRAHEGGSILLKYLFTFERQCRDKLGITECDALICPSATGSICNFMKNKPEIIYIDANAKCTMNDGTPFYVTAKLPITVQDLKDDNTCCK
jgi:hypothetical protein